MRADKIESVENGLQPKKQIQGMPPKNILARMQELNIPSASITMIEGGDIAWSRDYSAGSQTAVDQDATGHAPVFQAASISKTVNAVLAMKLLVESGKIKIDDDLTSYLSEKMGVANHTGKPVTLAQLLSHTAGTTVHGGAGYATNSKHIPSTAEILAGNAKLKGNPPEAKDTHIPNTGPVEVVREPGKECVYSGGGVTIIQRLIELAYPNESYASLAQKTIFEPLGMTQSTFELQKPGNKPGNHVEHIQQGHGHDGRVIEGGWRMMPESAAGGLWTTSSDLAKFAIAICQMSLGNTNSILHPETVRQMLVKQPNASLPNASFGLGFAIYGEGDAVSFGHDGRSIGYGSEYIFFPRTGMGAVILTNSDNGNKLIEEIYCSIAENYGWSRLRSETLQSISLTEAELQKCVGEFASPDGKIFTSKIVGGELQLTLPNYFNHQERAELTFVPLSETKFFCVEYQFEVTFDPDYNAITFGDGMRSKRNDMILNNREAFVESIYQAIKNNYIFSQKPELEEIGFKSLLLAEIEKIFQENLRIGKKEFSDKINQFLSSIDPHLILQYDPAQISSHMQNNRIIDDPRENGCAQFHNLMPSNIEKYIEDSRNDHYGFRITPDDQVFIPHDIGYFKINGFYDPSDPYTGEAAKAKAHEILESMRGKKALVIDLRSCHGGDPKMVEFLLSYLLTVEDKEKIPRGIYNTIYCASTSERKDYRMRETEFCLNMPIRILTDGRTFSAGEEFSYDFKQLNSHVLHDDRIQLVGQSTRGGAHPMNSFPLMETESHTINPDYFLWVPDKTAVNPFTQTNWEDGPKSIGELPGVKPDVVVPAECNTLEIVVSNLTAALSANAEEVQRDRVSASAMHARGFMANHAAASKVETQQQKISDDKKDVDEQNRNFF